MQEHGYRISQVNQNYTQILGENAMPSLLDIPVKSSITTRKRCLYWPRR